jgi:hypothetical protein
MRRARALDETKQSVPDREADGSASRSTPLTLVSGALAGDDLHGVAVTVAQALRRPVAIAIPGLGEPVVHPADSLPAVVVAAIAGHAAAVSQGDTASSLRGIADTVPVRIGDQIVGIVAAAGHFTATADDGRSDQRRSEGERQAWLQAAAAAASLAALLREIDGETPGTAEALIVELAAGPPHDLQALPMRARSLGLDLDAGVTAISIRGDERPVGPTLPQELRDQPGLIVAELEPGRLVVVAARPSAPSSTADGLQAPGELADQLRARGLIVGVSTTRRDPAQLHDAVHEARLLAELQTGSEEPGGHDETYRLLIGVLLRDPAELALLRDRTVTPLSDYDDRHDTDLLATLRAFLVHDGSTTETAEAMGLHRHTVGYRLSRVHEVSGLSPYESGGRERLSLGLKAHDILSKHQQLRGPGPASVTSPAPTQY